MRPAAVAAMTAMSVINRNRRLADVGKAASVAVQRALYGEVGSHAALSVQKSTGRATPCCAANRAIA